MPNLIKNNINGFLTTIDINDIINLLDNKITTITESEYSKLKKI